jgi:hypothetical protein
MPPALPLSITINNGRLAEVTSILQGALQILGMFPGTAPEAALGSLLLQIISGAVARIQAETGKPIDLSKIPYEAPLP